ncbi:hypothetical protein EVAR_7977_1 [Eumeta japonica]|uniref:Uncharacterized protein n=1 Tax=Eumeta variegata TaxID=151549 RepID=A0A4C1TGW2_EUMVA|nr:hypothetical protein EVAR_7977_1 [Eumeta japonica]
MESEDAAHNSTQSPDYVPTLSRCFKLPRLALIHREPQLFVLFLAGARSSGRKAMLFGIRLVEYVPSFILESASHSTATADYETWDLTSMYSSCTVYCNCCVYNMCNTCATYLMETNAICITSLARWPALTSGRSQHSLFPSSPLGRRRNFGNSDQKTATSSFDSLLLMLSEHYLKNFEETEAGENLRV